MDKDDSLKNLYTTPDDRMDTILDRSHVTFWRCLRRAKPANITDPFEIANYVLDEFGVELAVTIGEFGGIGYAPEAQIVDEQKYLMFLLKYQS
jgi:hypothetical protein